MRSASMGRCARRGREPLQSLGRAEHHGATYPLQADEFTPLEDAVNPPDKCKSSLPIYEKMMVSKDAIEGPIAFAEKPKPVCKGR